MYQNQPFLAIGSSEMMVEGSYPNRFYRGPAAIQMQPKAPAALGGAPLGSPSVLYPTRYGWKNCKLNQPISHSDACNYDLIFFHLLDSYIIPCRTTYKS